MDWQKRAYKTYYDFYVFPEKGEVTAEKIEKHFDAWKHYYSRLLPQNREAAILDAGCGVGEIVYWLKNIGFEKTIGVESDAKQIQIAKNLGINGIISADFREFLKNKENAYDCIIARDVLEHFDKKGGLETLDIFYNSLKDDGRLIIQTPNAESPFGGRYFHYDFTHLSAFTKTSLNHALKTVGFKNTLFCPMRPAPHGLKSTVRYFLWRLIEAMIKTYILIETGSGKGIFTQNMIVLAEKKIHE